MSSIDNKNDFDLYLEGSECFKTIGYNEVSIKMENIARKLFQKDLKKLMEL